MSSDTLPNQQEGGIIAPPVTTGPPPVAAMPPPVNAVPMAPPPVLPASNPWSPASNHYGPVAMYPQLASPDDRGFVINVSAGRVAWKNRLSEYRKGQLVAGANGIHLAGKVIPPAVTRFFVYFFTGGLIGSLLIEHALLQDSTHFLPWDCIEGASYNPRSRRICLAYHLPANPKVSYALGLRMDTYSLEGLIEMINRYSPGTAREAKILSPTSLATWIFLGILALFVVVIIILANI